MTLKNTISGHFHEKHVFDMKNIYSKKNDVFYKMKNLESFLKNHGKMTRPCKTPHVTESVSMMLFIHDGIGLCHVDNVVDS